MENKEKIQKLLEIQKAYKSGKIKEKDIEKSDYDNLVKLYKIQNDQLRKRILEEKVIIKRKLNEINCK